MRYCKVHVKVLKVPFKIDQCVWVFLLISASTCHKPTKTHLPDSGIFSDAEPSLANILTYSF